MIPLGVDMAGDREDPKSLRLSGRGTSGVDQKRLRKGSNTPSSETGSENGSRGRVRNPFTTSLRGPKP